MIISNTTAGSPEETASAMEAETAAELLRFIGFVCRQFGTRGFLTGRQGSFTIVRFERRITNHPIQLCLMDTTAVCHLCLLFPHPQILQT